MRIKIIREHEFYEMGEHEVEDTRGEYLIKMGAAARVDNKIVYLDEKKELTTNAVSETVSPAPEVRLKRKYTRRSPLQKAV